MAKVRVWNDNIHDYKEKFRDEKIVIKAKHFIEMEEDQANLFRGTFSPILVDADGNKVAEGFKMIRLEKITESEAKALESFNCHVCQYEAVSGEGLDEHVKETHSHLLVKDELAEQDLRERKNNNKKRA